MENWTEVKTAYLLGRLGTVSATADSIGVHRATVIRRVESLESQLGGKLFQRHTRGYTPTELGRELVKVAERSNESFRQLFVKARTQDEDLAGQFTVSCPELVDDIVFSAVRAFKSEHPKVSVCFRSSNEVLKLEHGEADVAITIGDPPDHPDYVIIPLLNMSLGLYCSHRSIKKAKFRESDGLSHGDHQFIISEKCVYGQSVEEWIENNINSEQIVLTSSSIRGANDAVISGLGAGFLPVHVGRNVDQLSEVIPPLPEWNVPLSIITHIDLHRSVKVQSFLNIIKRVSRPDRSLITQEHLVLDLAV